MPIVSRLEKKLGIEVYVTKTKGIGGVIRFFFKDFVVEETLLDGSRAKVLTEQNQHNLNEFSVPKSWERYLICIMVKRGWDTLLAVRQIAQQLGIDYRAIQVAGIKDAKAWTAQHLSLKNVHPESLKKIRIEGLTITPIKYSHRPVSPYLLLGNHFRITIRKISIRGSEIKEKIDETWKQLENIGGIPNFFGHQRFGTTRPITHKVGKALVQGNFEKAVMTFLAESSPIELEASREAREKLLQDQDFTQALNYFPKHLKYERLMLRYLAKHPKGFAGAFRKLPLQLRRLFVQAYQSYLFNKFLSQRIEQGIPINQPQIGDFVVLLDKYGLPTPKCRFVNEENLAEIRETVRKKKMCIALPLPGYKQKLSRGIQGEIERKILEEEGISCRNFRIPMLKEINLKGKLRACLSPVGDFSFSTPTKDSANLTKRKVKLQFKLLRGSYATVVLREFMKPRNVIAAGF